MRVKRTLGMLLIVLLALCVFTPAAGAIYIEGQTIPDDGLMHIMSADVNTGEAAPAGMPVDADTPVSIPAGSLPSYVWDDSSTAGYTGLPVGFPASTLPLMMPYEGLIQLPAMTAPSAVADSSDGNVMENSLSPALSGIWSFFDAGNPQAGMPVLDDLFF